MSPRLRPDALLEVDLVPPGAKHLAAASAGQQQQADDVRSLLVVVAGEHCRQAGELVGAEIPRALSLRIALDALARIVETPAPTDAEIERLPQQGNDAIGPVLGAAAGDLTMEPVAIGEGNIGDLLVGEGREDDDLIVLRSSAREDGPLLTGVLLEVPRAELCHRRSPAPDLEPRERVTAIGAKLELQAPGLCPRRRQWPVRIAPDGVATLPAGAPIGEDERLGASGRDPDAEAFDAVVIDDAIADLGRGKPLD